MNVLVVTRATPLHSSAGGMERAAWDLAVSMARTESVVVLTTTVPGRTSTFTHEGVAVETIRGTRPGKYSARWWLATARMNVAGIDAVLSVSAGATAMIWLRRGPVYVFQAHGTASRELTSVIRTRPRLWALKALRLAYWIAIDRGTYRRSHAVVPIGPAVTKALQSRPYKGSFKRNLLDQIPNGINIERLSRAHAQVPTASARFGFAATEVLALVVARLSDQKGVDLAIDAVALTDANLLIVGTGEAEKSLRGHAIERGLGQRVRFMGGQDREGVRDALHAADVFLFTPRNLSREGLPLSVMEALAANVPVIAPDGSVWPENIRSHLSLVACANPGEIARAIAHANQLPRPYLAAEYSIDAVARRYLVLFRALKESRSG
jgi:glycosyltransferase involved in cell wall biosynthesis